MLSLANMSTRRLSPSEVEHYVVALDSFISQGMKDRLLALTEIMDDDGFIRLDRALERAVSPGAKDKMRAFRQFRQRLRKASVAAQIGFHLPVDDQWSKSAPHTRYCWFVVEEFTDQCALTVPSNNRRPSSPQVMTGPVGGPHPGNSRGEPGPVVPQEPATHGEQAMPLVARRANPETASPWVRSATRQHHRDGATGQVPGSGRATSRPSHGRTSGGGQAARPSHEAAYAPAQAGSLSQDAAQAATHTTPDAYEVSQPVLASPHSGQQDQEQSAVPAPVVGRVYVSTGTDLQPGEAHAVDEFVRELGVALRQQADYAPAVRCSWHLQLGVDALEERERLCRFADRAVVLVTPRMLRETYLEWPEISQVPHTVVQVSRVGDALQNSGFDSTPLVNPTEALVQMPPRSMRRVAHQVAAAVLASNDIGQKPESATAAGEHQLASGGMSQGRPAPSADVAASPGVPHCAASADNNGLGQHQIQDDSECEYPASSKAVFSGARTDPEALSPQVPSSAQTTSGRAPHQRSHQPTATSGSDVATQPAASAGRVVQPRNWTARAAGASPRPSQGNAGQPVGGDECDDSDPEVTRTHTAPGATADVSHRSRSRRPKGHAAWANCDHQDTQHRSGDRRAGSGGHITGGHGVPRAATRPGHTGTATAGQGAADGGCDQRKNLVSEAAISEAVSWAQRRAQSLGQAAPERVWVADFPHVVPSFGGELPRLEACEAVTWAARLTQWEQSDTPRCVLMGAEPEVVSVACQGLAAGLWSRQQAAPNAALPVFLTASSVPEIDGGAFMSAVLDASGPRAPTPEVLGAVVSAMPCVVILDGVGAAGGGARQLQQAWSALVDVAQLVGAAPHPGTKLLVSCDPFTFGEAMVSWPGQVPHRGRDYDPVVVVPTTADAVCDYVDTRVDASAVPDLLEGLAGALRCADQADPEQGYRRTGELLLVAEQVAFTGRVAYPADVVGAMVNRWLKRDNNPHAMRPEHKELLLELLAARVWESEGEPWHAPDLREWLTQAVPELVPKSYADRALRGWAEDVQAATFLRRDVGDYYGFAHPLVLDYFVASRLFRALCSAQMGEVAQTWALSRPSDRALIFVGQFVQQAAPEQQMRVVDMLGQCATGKVGQESSDGCAAVAVTVFRYGVLAAQHGYVHHDVRQSQLAGSDLQNLQCSARTGRTVSFSGIDLRGADLRKVRWAGVDCSGAIFAGAKLAGAEFAGCDLTGADFTGADLTGVLWRGCAIDGVKTTGAQVYRAQALHCSGVADLSQEWLLAPQDRPVASAEVTVQTLTGHCGVTTGGSVHPVAPLAITAGVDGTLCVWDVRTAELLRVLVWEHGAIQAVAWSPDGLRLAAGYDDGTVVVWDAGTGELVNELTGHVGSVRAVAWHPHGGLVASGGVDGAVRVWEWGSSVALACLEDVDSAVAEVAWRPDGGALAAANISGDVAVWEAGSWQLMLTVPACVAGAGALVWEPQGRRLAVASGASVQVWSTGDGRPGGAYSLGDGHIVELVWAVPQELSATVVVAGTVRTVDVFTGGQTREWACGPASVQWVRHTAEPGQALVGTDEPAVSLWDANTGEIAAQMSSSHGVVQAVSWSADGSELYMCAEDDVVRAIQMDTGLARSCPDVQVPVSRSVTWSADDSSLACGDDDGVLRLWDSDTGHCELSVQAHAGAVLAVAWNADGTGLATGGADGVVQVWDARTADLLVSVTGHRGPVHAVAWSPDGSLLAIAGESAVVRVWDTTTWEQVAWQVEHLPGGEVVVRDAPTGRVHRVSTGAWRWLGWPITSGGVMSRLPAEAFGELPRL